MMIKSNSPIWHLGLSSGGLAALLCSWQAGNLNGIWQSLFFVGAAVLAGLTAFWLDTLLQQTKLLRTTWMTAFIVVALIAVSLLLGSPPVSLFSYVAIGFLIGGLTGILKPTWLVFIYPLVFLGGVFFSDMNSWVSLVFGKQDLWWLTGVLVFLLLYFGLLGPSAASTFAGFTASLMLVLVMVWYSPLTGTTITAFKDVSMLTWGINIFIFLLLGGLASGPVQEVIDALRMAPAAVDTFFLRQARLFLKKNSLADIRTLSELYSNVSTNLRNSIFTPEAIQGNEQAWGSVIRQRNTLLGRDALNKLSNIKTTKASALHKSLVKIFSDSMTDPSPDVWKPSLDALINLDISDTLRVCKQLAIEQRLEPIQAYLSKPGDALYRAGMAELIKIQPELQEKALASFVSFMEAELHNSSPARVKIAFDEIKKSKHATAAVVHSLSDQYRNNRFQKTDKLLLDLIQLDRQSYLKEAEWATVDGTNSQFLTLLRVDGSGEKVELMANILQAAYSGAAGTDRRDALCELVGNSIVAKESMPSVGTILAMSILSPEQTRKFFENHWAELPIHVVQQALGTSDSPLRNIFGDWLKTPDQKLAVQVVNMLDQLATVERSA